MPYSMLTPKRNTLLATLMVSTMQTATTDDISKTLMSPYQSTTIEYKSNPQYTLSRDGES